MMYLCDINSPHASDSSAICGAFFCPFQMKYSKTPITSAEHYALLLERGLSIADPDRAIKYLKTVGYFRLTGYMFHMQHPDGSHRFLEGASFDDVIGLYHFDKQLRGIIAEYLERIEICLRAKLTDQYSASHGFFWYSLPKLYDDHDIFLNINEEIREGFHDPKEQFLKRFKLRYTSETIPPSNMALETLSLGKLARLYKGLKNKDGKLRIAGEFDLPSKILTSWIIYLANVRNICAHHARLWNRKVTVNMPVFPSREKYRFKGDNFDDSNTTIYGIISMIDRLLSSFNPENSFAKKIEYLIDEHGVDCARMGFPANWRESANWKQG